MEVYLVTFERILTAHGIDENRWAHFLAPQLTGKAQLAFTALPTTSSDDYEAIKAVILARYGINEDAYRVRFRGFVRREGETNRETTTRLMDLLQKWMKEHLSWNFWLLPRLLAVPSVGFAHTRRLTLRLLCRSSVSFHAPIAAFLRVECSETAPTQPPAGSPVLSELYVLWTYRTY